MLLLFLRSVQVSIILDLYILREGAPYQLIGGSLVMTPAPEVYRQCEKRDVGSKTI